MFHTYINDLYFTKFKQKILSSSKIFQLKFNLLARTFGAGSVNM